MKHILIPTDFSENNWNAIRYALHFFRDTKVHFYLLHVSHEDILERRNLYDSELVTVSPLKKKGAPPQLFQLVKQVQEVSPNSLHEFSIHHEVKLFVESIREYVKSYGIDYIVMGTKGSTNMERQIVGSHTGAVITRVKCPIIIVPKNAHYQGSRNVVLPTDFNMVYKERVLRTLEKITQIDNAALRVLYVICKEHDLSSLQKKNKNFLKDRLQYSKHSFHYECRPCLEEGLQNFVSQQHPELIALVAKNLNFIQRILFNPPKEGMTYQEEVPFLVLHE